VGWIGCSELVVGHGARWWLRSACGSVNERVVGRRGVVLGSRQQVCRWGACLMRFGILGPLEVVDDHGHRVGLSARKERALLAILLLHANEVVSADRLVEDLWAGGPPATAAKGLHVHVSRLRGRLAAAAPGEERLLTEPSGYRLHVAAGELDSAQFEGLLQRASGLIAAGSSEQAVELLGEALGLWRGAAFSGFEYEQFAQVEIARLSELRVVAVEQRIAAELELGRAELLIGELEQLVREHPYRERFRGQLMLALYRTGRQAEALQAYRAARSLLVDELGIEPSAELRELHESVLAQDESILVAVSRTAGTGAADSLGWAIVRPPSNAGTWCTNLPPQTRGLVGRERERARLRELVFADSRSIVTVTGIGGVGKTRLAIAVGAELLDQSPGGVFLVRLAGIHDPDSILPMIADAVGIAGGTGESLECLLVRRLGQQRAILILDNFEQLLGGSSIVGELAASAQHLQLVITSQVPLRIGAERILALGPLASADAAALFIERARARETLSPSTMNVKRLTTSALGLIACRSRSSLPPRASAFLVRENWRNGSSGPWMCLREVTATPPNANAVSEHRPTGPMRSWHLSSSRCSLDWGSAPERCRLSSSKRFRCAAQGRGQSMPSTSCSLARSCAAETTAPRHPLYRPAGPSRLRARAPHREHRGASGPPATRRAGPTPRPLRAAVETGRIHTGSDGPVGGERRDPTCRRVGPDARSGAPCEHLRRALVVLELEGRPRRGR
jgi:DNA-binding SARP family transcriptional activator